MQRECSFSFICEKIEKRDQRINGCAEKEERIKSRQKENIRRKC